MRIIHLIGPRCAGKTTVRRCIPIPSWDILDFYRRNRCLQGGMINWNRYDKIRPKLIPTLHAWLELQRNEGRKAVLLESSGVNQTIEAYLASCEHPIAIVSLQPPTEEALRDRCAIMKLPFADVKKYNDRWMGKALLISCSIASDGLTSEQAIKKIMKLNNTASLGINDM